MWQRLAAVFAVIVGLVAAQGAFQQAPIPGSFALPNAVRGAALPEVDESIVQYFDLPKEQRALLDLLTGPRDGSIIPPAQFQLPPSRQNPIGGAPGSFSLPRGLNIPGALNLPAGFNPESLLADPNILQRFSSQFQQPGNGQFASLPANPNAAFNPLLGNGGSPAINTDPSNGGSSIAGIPNIAVNLPKAPVPQQPQPQPQGNVPFVPPPAQPIVQPAGTAPSIPRVAISERPNVPQGGLGPLAASIDSVPGGSAQPTSFGTPGIPDHFASPNAAAVNVAPNGQGGLLGTVMSLLGAPGGGSNGPVDTQQFLRNLQAGLGGGNLPLGDQNNGLLQRILYNSLAADALQADAGNGTDAQSAPAVDEATLRNRTTKALTENMALIQDIITQPSSPFCNPKPTPVNDLNIDAFMGTWYQVLYSPPLSVGPCSMISYVKQASVADDGPGTVFSTFEYTNEGTPFGPPKISSGYAIVQGPGRLIYRTTANENDVSVNVIALGPINANSQYEWVVLSVNCNYPLHVFARDTVAYKRDHEAQVNAMLAQRGLTTGIARMLNFVDTVDTTLCSFPSNLFSLQG